VDGGDLIFVEQRWTMQGSRNCCGGEKLWDAGVIVHLCRRRQLLSSHYCAKPITAATTMRRSTIDLPDPTAAEQRYAPGVKPSRAGLAGVDRREIAHRRRAPPHRTASLLLFQADHAITQDALHASDQKLLDLGFQR
jgi:ethanolamine ammonia-lyase small subunit